MSFKKDLEESILKGEGDRKKLLIQAFKMIMAKMMEKNVVKNADQLEAGFIEALRGYIISEFRKANLGVYQLSETAYSRLFDDSLQEIFTLSANNHEGEDKVELDKNQNLSIDARGYQHEVRTKAGLYVPPSAISS